MRLPGSAALIVSLGLIATGCGTSSPKEGCNTYICVKYSEVECITEGVNEGKAKLDVTVSRPAGKQGVQTFELVVIDIDKGLSFIRRNNLPTSPDDPYHESIVYVPRKIRTGVQALDVSISPIIYDFEDPSCS